MLLGDLNATTDDAAVRIIESHGTPERSWRDAWKETHGRARGGTWPALVPWRRIDYVFVSPLARWRIVDCERVPYSGSDHLGLVVRLRLEPRDAHGERRSGVSS